MPSPNVLIIHPRFRAGSFWNYSSACELLGAKYPAPPLGLITVAAMLPQDWPIKLVDLNVDDPEKIDFDWADLVLIGGMLPQQEDILHWIAAAQAAKVPCAIGGPDVSSSPQIYEHADFRIIGEAEGAIDDFVAAWKRGERSGEFRAPLHSVDITKTPIPRYDLLNFDMYTQIGTQFSRGCPFLCEFCDIIELFGRKPRTKTNGQMLAELDRLYELGHRGQVDFVDDNLIGNKKAVKAFLPHLIAWQKEHSYPFEFTTEASLNLSDDEEFLGMMRDAGFLVVFIGIESPDPEVLAATQKKQNTKRDIAACVHKINSYGIFVVAGFIVGFDNERETVADDLLELIEEASISVAMTGLLYALPNTQLSRRLVTEGRLHDAIDTKERMLKGGDQCVAGLNFATLRPRQQIMADYLKVIETAYDKRNYFARVRRTVELLDVSGNQGAVSPWMVMTDLVMLVKFLWKVTLREPEVRGPVWRVLGYTIRKNPAALKHALYMGALYVHLGPFSRFIAKEIRQKMADIAADPDYESQWSPVQNSQAALPDPRERAVAI